MLFGFSFPILSLAIENLRDVGRSSSRHGCDVGGWAFWRERLGEVLRGKGKASRKRSDPATLWYGKPPYSIIFMGKPTINGNVQ